MRRSPRSSTCRPRFAELRPTSTRSTDRRRGRRRPAAASRSVAVVIGIVLAGGHPGAHRLLHRHRQAPGQGRRQDLAHRRRPPSSSPASRSASSRPSTPRSSSAPPSSAPSCSAAARSTVSLFAVALAGCGLLTTVGVIVAMDTFGPVSDNAQGIAEMSGDVDAEGAQILTELDAVGNTTKAITKGIAIATAVLAATALFGSYTDASVRPAAAIIDDGEVSRAERVRRCRPSTCRSSHPNVLVGVLLGAAVVFLFSGLAINAVARAAGAVVFEVRRQFREHPRDHGGHRKPEYGKVVDISPGTRCASWPRPGLLAVAGADRRRLRPRRRPAGRLPRRRDRHRHADGGLPGQLRWRLGQRQEARRGRHPRRQGLARPRGHDHRRHRRRPVQGHRRPGDQPADQGDEPGLAADRAAPSSP